MKSAFVLRSLSVAVFLGFAPAAFAAPPIWESDLGAALSDLTGEDDNFTEVSLSFPFVFEDTSYSNVIVGTNGGIQLGEDGDDDDIDYDYWEDDYFDDFNDDGGFPVILPFGTDVDLSATGTIHFNDFGDRAVFTWNEVGTNEEEEHLSTFQIQLLADGRIIFSYNGILDGLGEDLVGSLGAGILVGISGSTGVFPGPSDLSASPSTATDTIYELWQGDEDPLNSLFDLDMTSVCFVPQPGGGFSVECEEPTGARPDLQIGKSFSQLKGDGVSNRRKASRKQTLVRPARIFKTNTQRAALLLQNDGGTAANLSLKSSGDRLPRMKVTARSGGKNVSAAVQSGRFSRNVEPGGSVRVLCRVQTNRFYAGGLRNGDRDDTIRFRLTGGGGRDNAAMVIKYIGPAGATRL